MMKPFFLAIEGAIGVGKTTLARLLQPRFEAKLVLEAFEENPFLSNFYSDRSRYAFQTQLFFLLSRYRQQQAIPSLAAEEPVIGDYTFGKDSLFAHLNLEGDELDMYRRLYGVLADRIAVPDLVIYLQADTDVLMARIAARDRPYEREMDRDYIAKVNEAYEQYFAKDMGPAPRTSSLLTIDTNDLNYVRDASALAFVEGKVKRALDIGAYQRPLPQIEEVSQVRIQAGAGSPRPTVPGEALHAFLAANEAVGRVGTLLASQGVERSGQQVSNLRSSLQQAMERLTSLADSVGVDLTA